MNGTPNNLLLFWKRLTGREEAPGRSWAAASLLWSLLMLLGAAVCIGLLSLYFAAGDFKLEMFWSYFDVPWLVPQNLLPVLALALLLWFLCGRVWLSVLLCGVVTMAFTIVNALKISLRSTPLLWEDLALAGEAGKMAGRYAVGITPGQLAAVGLVLLAAAAAALLTRRRLRPWPVRLAGAAAVTAAALLLWKPVYQNTALYQATENSGLINIWSDVEVYQSRGFFYPFLYSSLAARDDPPAGYDPDQTARTLAELGDSPIPEDRRVSVLAVMLEAYTDLTEISGMEFAEPVYAPFHALEEESWSGTLVTNTFAGGTIDSERCFLTGMSTLGSFRAPSNSYVWYFRDQGYSTQGSHPGYNWFYNRLNVNENLGFQEYLFSENYYAGLVDPDTAPDSSDDVLFPQLLELLSQADKPCFSFSVSYQNHGPYASEETRHERYVPGDKGWSAATCNILNNYLDGIRRTNEVLARTVEELRSWEEPVVLVLFGDHKPWLGDGNSVYHEIGADISLEDDQSVLNYYGTPYLIWANPAAREALGRDIRGEGPVISPCFLMNQLFDQCGWEGPAFLKLAGQVMEQVPVINASGIYWENGTSTRALSPQGQELVDLYRQAEYYWRTHFAG